MKYPEPTPVTKVDAKVVAEGMLRGMTNLAVRITMLSLLLNLVLIPSGMSVADKVWLGAVIASFLF